MGNTFVDTFFAQGSTHIKCEDYASDSNKGVQDEKASPMVVLSDGCSSSPHTDMGSRLLCMSAWNHMREESIPSLQRIVSDAQFTRRSSSKVRPYAGLLGSSASSNAFDATLLLAWRCLEGVTVKAAGDGVVVGRRRDGSFDVFVISFFGNAPAYLSYLQNEARAENYLSLGYGQRKITKYRMEGLQLKEIETSENSAALIGGSDEGWVETFRFPYMQYDLVAIFSDGVETFVDTSVPGKRTPVGLANVLYEVFSLKSYGQNFVQRRVKRFLQKTCPKRCWSHEDDFSVGMIYMGELSKSESIRRGEG